LKVQPEGTALETACSFPLVTTATTKSEKAQNGITYKETIFQWEGYVVAPERINAQRSAIELLYIIPMTPSPICLPFNSFA